MQVNLTLTLVGAAMIGCGIYLMLERSLSRVLVGLVVMSNGISLLFLVSGGPAGDAPLVRADGSTDPSGLSDPLPQALVLTAIVITLATTAFVLAMAYRSWQLNQNDDVQDDDEDARIRRLALEDESSGGHDLTEVAEHDDDVPAEEGS